MTSRQHPDCIPILPTIASALFWWHPDSTQTVSWYCTTLSLHYSDDIQTAPGLYPDIVQHCPCIILMTSRQHPDCILLLSNIASALFWWHPDSTRTVSWCCPTLSLHYSSDIQTAPGLYPDIVQHCPALIWWHPDSTHTVSRYYLPLPLHYSDDIQTAPRLYPDIVQHCPCIILMTSRQHPDCILILYNTFPALFWWHPDSTRTVSWYCTTLSLHYSNDIQTAPRLYPVIVQHCLCIILMTSRQHPYCIPILPTISSALFWWHPDSTQTVSQYCPALIWWHPDSTHTVSRYYPPLPLHYSDDIQTAPGLYPDVAQHCPCIILMTSRQHPDCIPILPNIVPALFWWHPDSTRTVSWYCTTLSLHYSGDTQTAPGLYPDIVQHFPALFIDSTWTVSCIILMTSRQHPDCILILYNTFPALFWWHPDSTWTVSWYCPALFWWHPDSTRTVSWYCTTLSLHYSNDIQTAPRLYPVIVQHCLCIILMTSRQHPYCIPILPTISSALFWWHPDSTRTVSQYCPTLSCINLMTSRQHPYCIPILPTIASALFWWHPDSTQTVSWCCPTLSLHYSDDVQTAPRLYPDIAQNCPCIILMTSRQHPDCILILFNTFPALFWWHPDSTWTVSWYCPALFWWHPDSTRTVSWCCPTLSLHYSNDIQTAPGLYPDIVQHCPALFWWHPDSTQTVSRYYPPLPLHYSDDIQTAPRLYPDIVQHCPCIILMTSRQHPDCILILYNIVPALF